MKDNPVFIQILQFERQDTLKVVRFIARLSNIDFPKFFIKSTVFTQHILLANV